MGYGSMGIWKVVLLWTEAIFHQPRCLAPQEIDYIEDPKWCMISTINRGITLSDKIAQNSDHHSKTTRNPESKPKIL